MSFTMAMSKPQAKLTAAKEAMRAVAEATFPVGSWWRVEIASDRYATVRVSGYDYAGEYLSVHAPHWKRHKRIHWTKVLCGAEPPEGVAS